MSFWQQIFTILMIHILCLRNFVMTIYTLFPSISYGWKAVIANLFAFWMYEAEGVAFLGDIFQGCTTALLRLISYYPMLCVSCYELSRMRKQWEGWWSKGRWRGTTSVWRSLAARCVNDTWFLCLHIICSHREATWLENSENFSCSWRNNQIFAQCKDFHSSYS